MAIRLHRVLAVPPWKNPPRRLFPASIHDDLMRLGTEEGPKNMATIKHMAMNLIRAAPGKDRLRSKRKAAGWDQDYLKTIITKAGK